ncbi:hypothetical protein INR77_01675 [Erythrobacter sp. SCSIO 43205]|uniref:DUF6489 family protein n=1 Tax=Erythrobacter sp. SCSIO 43205 TaxID=2779361 RepID=UPI001CA9A01E|nr:DUF6489 family protein [Erythrobacter sp. SCSIO 43205]UAB78476.1 hypothetical protein INR77_01675 [Erythrobacter sp. SCSIO 43205]
MKINIEIDCTPQEAREFMGLPDVSEANKAFVDGMTKAVENAQNPAQLLEMGQMIAPMGQAGLKLFQSFVEGGMRAAGGSGSSGSKSSKG